MSALALGGFKGVPTNPLEDPVEKMLAAKKERDKTPAERTKEAVQKEMERVRRFPLAVPSAAASAALDVKINK